ncbi:MAG: hypothetical protein ABH821_01495 [archaeon]
MVKKEFLVTNLSGQAAVKVIKFLDLKGRPKRAQVVEFVNIVFEEKLFLEKTAFLKALSVFYTPLLNSMISKKEFFKLLRLDLKRLEKQIYYFKNYGKVFPWPHERLLEKILKKTGSPATVEEQKIANEVINRFWEKKFKPSLVGRKRVK